MMMMSCLVQEERGHATIRDWLTNTNMIWTIAYHGSYGYQKNQYQTTITQLTWPLIGRRRPSTATTRPWTVKANTEIEFHIWSMFSNTRNLLETRKWSTSLINNSAIIIFLDFAINFRQFCYSLRWEGLYTGLSSSIMMFERGFSTWRLVEFLMRQVVPSSSKHEPSTFNLSASWPGFASEGVFKVKSRQMDIFTMSIVYATNTAHNTNHCNELLKRQRDRLW